MKNLPLLLFLVLFLCPACSQPPATPQLPPPPPDTSEQAPSVPETEDHVLLTLEAPLADGRTLTLEAFGRRIEQDWGVREVRVYDGADLLQTVSAREAIELEWEFGDGVLAEDFYDYTTCWSPEMTMEVLDLNLDGNADFGLFGWVPNNTIPYYYWQWDGERYQFACTLQDAEVHPETGEVSTEYKAGWGGVQYQRDYYRPDGEGNLYLIRRERECFDFPNLDYDRGFALETWVPREGAVIRPRPAGQDEEGEMVLIRREIPVYEVREDDTAAHFTEVWELRDGRLRMVSRDEFVYDED